MEQNKTRILIAISAALLMGAAFYFLRSTPSATEVASSKPADLPQVAGPQAPQETTPERLPEPMASSILRDELQATMNELPQVEALQNLSDEELHHTPPIVYEGGMMIGEVIEKAEKDPARRKETVKFLKSCAENDEVIHQIRAVCWNRTLALITEWKVFVPISDAHVPDDIRDLAAKLP